MTFRKTTILATMLAVLIGVSISLAHTCGTLQAIQYQRETVKSTKVPSGRSSYTGCNASDYYDSVLTQKTEHFEIFYTLTGPHQTTKAFIDTLAKDVEYAYTFHTKKMGMRAPLGSDTTIHYLKAVTPGLYPVEVIDLDLLRDVYIYMGSACHGCFGTVLSNDYSSTKTTLLIDNDFRFTPKQNSELDTLEVNGKQCVYEVATQELDNSTYSYSYADHWENAIRVTAVHELYHAVQLRYLDFSTNFSFWFEASATGMEEAAAPDIDDYFRYLPKLMQSMGTPWEQVQSIDYGVSAFFLYLYNHLSTNADRFIWENFSKNPTSTFWQVFEDYASANKLAADSLYQDFSTRLSFSGERSALLDTAQWIASDESNWPAFKYKQHSNSAESFIPELELNSYQFHNGGKPSLSTLKGKATAIAYRSDQATVHPIESTNEADSLYSAWSREPTVDSIMWIFSRFNDNSIPTRELKDSTLRAYPTPWREGNLCFTALPANKKFIEIRNRRGDLVTREKYDSQTLCLEESRVKKIMVPGVYRFRAGSSGKTKDFIVLY